MKRIYFIFFVFSFLVSCKIENENNLIGDWYELDNYIIKDIDDTLVYNENEPPRPPSYYPNGLSFISKDSVKSFLGVWKKKKIGYKYLGEYRTYKIVKDSIKFYNPNEINPIKKFRFNFIAADTLRFYSNDTTFKTYVKFETKITNYQQLDSIKIIETDGREIYIDYLVSSTGRIQIRDSNLYNSSQTKILKGEISISTFKSIEERYNWAHFMNLGDYSGCCDGIQLTTIFYSRGEKIKSISDYENSSPMRFIWANVYLMNIVENKLLINAK